MDVSRLSRRTRIAVLKSAGVLRKIYTLPSDEALIGWAREKFNLPPLPGPPPAPPTPLPNQPAPTYPDNCVGRCWREGHCCANMISGCGQPTCFQGCAYAQVAPDLASCKAACTASTGCSHSYKNVSIQMCDSCASVTPPQECAHEGHCENIASCQDGCANHFSPDGWY